MDIEKLKIIIYEIACRFGAVAVLGSYLLFERSNGKIDTMVGYNGHILLAGGLGLVLCVVSMGCAAWVGATREERDRLTLELA